jgi:AcrR family transcriptional regulator
MPKETFFNLPPDKAARIVDAAIDEFGANPYEAASVNRIVEQSGIAKGSFYQYFADKEDLFRHILDQIVAEKLAFLSPVLANPHDVDFFTLLRELYLSGLRFANSQPRLQQIGVRLLSDRSNPVFQEVVRDNLSKSDQIFRALIEAGIARGDIRSDIDPGMIAFLFTRLNGTLVEYYQEHFQTGFDEQYLVVINQLIDFLYHGIGSKELNDHDTNQ